jgi:hypothetical protein
MEKNSSGTGAMNIKQTLQNPFVLVAQGFAVGALLFFSTMPREEAPVGADRAAAAAVAKTVRA